MKPSEAMNRANPGEILLDVRTLEHPIPFEMATEALKNLKSGEQIHMIHRREPFPLYDYARQRGFMVHTHQREEALFDIWIWRQEGEQSPGIEGDQK